MKWYSGFNSATQSRQSAVLPNLSFRMSVVQTIGVMKNSRLIRLDTTCGMSRKRVEAMPNSSTTQPALTASRAKPGMASSTSQFRPGCVMPSSVIV